MYHHGNVFLARIFNTIAGISQVHAARVGQLLSPLQETRGRETPDPRTAEARWDAASWSQLLTLLDDFVVLVRHKSFKSRIYHRDLRH